ncbi:DUF3604 domain-containing protein [Halieaceae bacterium IMCC14734]|uniref:DUF3604 domain-containing protein n=1 Tax=Candidatus Litorirhabdus singularis TaxID=2518993 RepID=A0ABT3TNA5_9GAMM|nr:DUF3604 domain-containing protein [Candidatus Litorirhabdus singularis]MCX2983255.1 DUF3604 domain-containing protein [Candidatus Litorirhabdus singularis]
MKNRVAIIILGLALLGGCGTEAPPETVFDAVDLRADKHKQPRPRCHQYSEQRNAYFGDLHVHTSVSNDAWSFDVRVDPDGAYGYAFGDSVKLPLGDDYAAREVRIDRPLDFAGVTDHAEFFGEAELCKEQGASAPEFCQVFGSGAGRNPKLVMRITAPFQLRPKDLCGADGKLCGAAAETVWHRAVATAERWNDTTADCKRTTFVAYEYSSFRMGSNLHRNVIFRNAVVPNRPISYLDAIREWDMWRLLKEKCIDGSDLCDVLAIPHNSNISNGRMFNVTYPGANSVEEQVARAKLRMEIEPIIEIMQHKGDSECRNGLNGVLGGVDELCDFEKFENLAFTSITGSPEVDDCYAGPLSDWVPHLGPSCLDRNSYVRYALTEGLKEEARIGVNPFKFGISASTDTHNGLAGGVQERNYPGHLGNGDATERDRVRYTGEVAGNTSNGPGGLIGIWAEENTRDSLFDGMRRKEVFGTSGPRIQPRFFGGWKLPKDLCSDPAMVSKAYASGVPMGADLPGKSSASPTFLVSAAADAGSAEFPGMPLQQLQVIKGWYDDNGDHQQRVITVAGDANNGATVNLDSCAPQGEGFAQLCSVWQDPDFDAKQRAVYYLRAVENPSCRYSAWQCLELPENERPADCASAQVPKLIQERAWSSPIWYTPS